MRRRPVLTHGLADFQAFKGFDYLWAEYETDKKGGQSGVGPPETQVLKNI
jgi:hypothetical protein